MPNVVFHLYCSVHMLYRTWEVYLSCTLNAPSSAQCEFSYAAKAAYLHIPPVITVCMVPYQTLLGISWVRQASRTQSIVKYKKRPILEHSVLRNAKTKIHFTLPQKIIIKYSHKIIIFLCCEPVLCRVFDVRNRVQFACAKTLLDRPHERATKKIPN